jgi:hypothetical protein
LKNNNNNIHNLSDKIYHVPTKNRGKYDNINFEPWLVGLTDANGKFIAKFNSKKQFYASYSLCVNRYHNILLSFVSEKFNKSKLRNLNNWDPETELIITDLDVLYNRIIPIFDKYPLLIKYNRKEFIRFKYILDIYNDNKLNNNEKIALINKVNSLKNSEIEDKSPWLTPALRAGEYNIAHVHSFDEISHIISKDWITGYFETQASFSWSSKSKNKLTHNFNISSSDYNVIHSIKLLFKINANIRFKDAPAQRAGPRHLYYIETTAKNSIKFIINYFYNNNKDSLYWIGRLYWEFTLWTKTYYSFSKEYKKHYEELIKIRGKIRQEKAKYKGPYPYGYMLEKKEWW